MISAAFLAAAALAGSSPPAQAPPLSAEAPACPVRAGWGSARLGGQSDPFDSNVIVNAIRVGPDGALSWNGSPVERERVVRYLHVVALMLPRPHLVVAPERGAGCTELGDAAAFVDRHLDCTPLRCWISESLPHLPPPPAPPPPGRR